MADTDGNLREPLVPNFRRIRGTRLYRSSNLNFASDEKIHQMTELNIRAILDFRTSKEFSGKRASPMDSHYLKITPGSDLTPYQSIDDRERQILLDQEVADGKVGFRYSCDFLDTGFMKQLIWDSPWYLKPLFLLLLLIDLVHGSIALSYLALIYRLNYCGGLRQNLIDLLEWKGRVINEVLRLLSTPGNCPAVVMCRLGKDRTGLISALVQSICQVDRETIIADYAQSDVEWESNREFILASMRPYKISDEMGYAPPQVLRDVFQHIEVKYGSVSGYLESIGFCSLMQEKLRQTIQLEKSPLSGHE